MMIRKTPLKQVVGLLWSQADVILTFVLVIGVAAVYSLPQDLPPEILKSHVREFNLTGTRFQLVFYLLLVILSLTAFFFQQWKCRSMEFNPQTDFREVIVKIMIGMTLLRAEPIAGAAFIFSTSLAQDSQRLKPSRGRKSQTGGVIVIVLAIAMYSINSVGNPILNNLVQANDLDSSVGISSHYAMTIMPGLLDLRLQDAFSSKRLNYGMFMPLTARTLDNVHELLTGSRLDPVIVVALAQMLTIAILILIFFQISRNHWWKAILVSLLAFPKLGFTNLGTPNTLGIRYLPVLLMILLATTAIKSRWPVKTQHVILALAVGAMGQLSPEFVPVAIGIAVGVFLIPGTTRSQINHEMIKRLGKLVVSCAFALLLVSSLTGLWLGRNIVDNFQATVLYARGYGGLGIRWIPIGGLLFLIALSQIRDTLRPMKLHFEEFSGLKLGISLGMLLWFPYYINRMDNRNNLWFLILLAGLVLYVSISHGREWSKRFRELVIFFLTSHQHCFSIRGFKPGNNERLLKGKLSDQLWLNKSCLSQ